ncbi:hypothetical protein [Shouchella miscanthi]|uniref:SpuA C-terminal domain-containing protein n=1 Tax=Shouchella miscanthi TaxID=2598861 RepID=A0ABU6NID8_9BACI|nr:hypothetical protein [Shouchella miscanthi]
MILLIWKTNMVSHLKIHNFIHNSTDVVNQFDWTKAEGEGIHNDTMNYTKGLIQLRRSSNAFRLGSLSVIEEHVSLVEAPKTEQEDVAIGYTLKSTDESGTYTVFINGDTRNRTFSLESDLSSSNVLVDREKAGVEPIDDLSVSPLMEIKW